MKTSDELSRVMKIVGGVGAVTTGVALAVFGPHEGISVAVGAVIALSNLWVLGKIVASVLPPPEAAPKAEGNDATDPENVDAAKEGAAAPEGSGKSNLRAAWTAFAFLKILVLFGGAWLLMSKGLVSPMGLVAGYGSLPIGIALSTLFSSMRPR